MKFIRLDTATLITAGLLAIMLLTINIRVRRGRRVGRMFLGLTVFIWASTIVQCILFFIRGG